MSFDAPQHLLALFTLLSLATMASIRREAYPVCLVDSPRGPAESEPY